jgi:hypothetical protein
LDGLVGALHAPGPDGDHAEQLSLFGRLIGSWEIEWSAPPGEPQLSTPRGELHFGWVLGGRAVQDVWIVPGRGLPGSGHRPGFYGTTIRFYDPELGAWRSTWVEPVNGRVRRFIGRPDDDGIVLLSDEDEPQLRWRIDQITDDGFRWRSEASRDGGQTWVPDEQMLATRKPA